VDSRTHPDKVDVGAKGLRLRGQDLDLVHHEPVLLEAFSGLIHDVADHGVAETEDPDVVNIQIVGAATATKTRVVPMSCEGRSGATVGETLGLLQSVGVVQS